MYFKAHINIKKIPKNCKKNCEFAKKIHCFSLFEVFYNWVKFRRLKMGDSVYNSWESKTQPCYEGNTINLLKQHCEQYLGLS